MAEARSEEEEENMRDTREQVVRRQANSSGGRARRRKPEHRLSQGPLSSIRAAFKRTSSRSSSLSETPGERERERERDREREREREQARERDRRRPEITILSAEPLASSSWFPGPSGGFPLPPPPPAQIWGSSIPPSIQPPPSYEEVIREKTQEQVLRPSSSACSLSSSHSASTITIATQTDKGSPLGTPDTLVYTPPTGSQPSSPPSTSSRVPNERPRPRPRSKLSAQAVDTKVKVQTLVKLREDGLATLAARAGSKQEVTQGRYLQELLEAFSSDDWGFPDHQDCQYDTEDEEDIEDMSSLKARIQAFEQQQQHAVHDSNDVDGSNLGAPKRPEPQPRPRLQSQPAKSPPPIVAPKPKVLSDKPSSKGFWEEESSTANLGSPDAGTETNSRDQTAVECISTSTSEVPQPFKKPEVTPKPTTEPPHSSAPVPTPRDREASAAHPKPPPRPTVAPRVGPGAPHPEKSPKRRQTAPTLPPRPTLELICGGQIKPTSQEVETEVQTVFNTRPSDVKPLPLRPPPIKAAPGRPPPPSLSGSSKTTCIPAAAPSAGQVSSSLQVQKAPKKGPPLPPRPKPGHPLYNSYTKQEVLIVLDDPSPAAPQHPVGDGTSQTEVPLISDSLQCLLDLDTPPQPVQDPVSQSKHNLSQVDLVSILPVLATELKERSDAPVSGPQCVALFDYEGEEEDELTFSQGDVISLLEPVDSEWLRGQIHGRVGIFPLRFANVVEPLVSEKNASELIQSIAPKTAESCLTEADEWAVALFDFPGQTAGDLSFHKGALIQVIEHIDHEWRRGKLEGREGLYPAAFTQSCCQARPISERQPSQKGVAKAVFDFTAQSEEELTLKAGDVITEVEAVDEQWIAGVVGGKRGIVPKNYISLVS
ncbi:uncharacterized protein ACB057_017793 [Neosynchiropus ocellatus]